MNIILSLPFYLAFAINGAVEFVFLYNFTMHFTPLTFAMHNHDIYYLDISSPARLDIMNVRIPIVYDSAHLTVGLCLLNSTRWCGNHQSVAEKVNAI